MSEDLCTLVGEPSAAYLHVRASGARTRASVTALTVQVCDAALASGLSKAPIDVRELEGGSIPDSYLVVTEVFQRLRGRAGAGWPPWTRVSLQRARGAWRPWCGLVIHHVVCIATNGWVCSALRSRVEDRPGRSSDSAVC